MFSLVASRMRWARSQASSSVGPRIGRKLTLIRGASVSRPAFFGGLVHRVDLLLRLRQRLAPQRVDVGVLAADPVRRRRGAAEVQADPGLLRRLDGRVEVLDLVVPAVVAERLVRGPGLLDDVQVLVGAGVPLVLGQVVAVAALFGVAAAGDDVHGDAAAGELVEGGEGAGGQGGRDEARAVRDEEAEPLGVRGGVGGDLGAVRLRRRVADQHPVEAGVLVGAGEAPDVVRVDDRAGGEPGFRLVLGADHADELDGHGPGFLPCFGLCLAMDAWVAGRPVRPTARGGGRRPSSGPPRS